MAKGAILIINNNVNPLGLRGRRFKVGGLETSGIAAGGRKLPYFTRVEKGIIQLRTLPSYTLRTSNRAALIAGLL